MDPANDANPSPRCKKYSDLLVDRPFSPALKKTDPIIYMMYCLRYRMELNVDQEEEDDWDDLCLRGTSTQHNSPAHSLYDMFLKLLQEFDAAGRSEIFRLLMERRLAIPLLLPNGEHHLPLLRSVFKEVSTEQTICLGEDVTLMRVAIISCKEKSQSQSSELLREVFHIKSLQGEDLCVGRSTAQPTTAEIGFGVAKKAIVEHLTSCKRPNCQCPQKMAVLHFLVLHVIGEFEQLWEFIKEFADYLIVEDSTEETNCFHRRSLPDVKKLNIVVWRTSSKPLVAEWEGTEQKYGFQHLRIHSPSGERLYKVLAKAVNKEQDDMNKKPAASIRTPLHQNGLLRCQPVPFSDSKIESFIGGLNSFKTIRKESFVLQKSICRQHQLDIKKGELETKAQNKDVEGQQNYIDQQISDEMKLRNIHVSHFQKDPLIDLLLNILKQGPASTRIFEYRKLEMSLAKRSDSTLAPIKSEITELTSKFAKMSQLTDENVERDARDKLIDAKNRYNMAVVGPEHIWREMSHLYAADHSKYRRFPGLAAQHLVDGMCVELLDGDSNMINLPWIKAILSELDKRLKGNQESSRIFVLSIMGVQSSGKSTLLNIMFGIRMKTSVGQCTRGINMQLIPVVGRKEYDYILLLDTEGTRSPEYWGLPGSEKRDNQMATVSILLADATIIVNPGENDAAVKEILPIVLLAYQRSKLAQEKGGQMSSMVFFVYNRIDTQQRNKMSNILQLLGSSLHEAFKVVSRLVGANVQSQESTANPFSLFREFQLDASNSKVSDVRILGNTKKSFTPPDDVPDPAYGEALAEFWQHIHSRVTSQLEWRSRTLSKLHEYLDLVWNCLLSADFNLNFKNVMERTAYDEMNRELKACEKQLSEEYRNKFHDQETEILDLKRNAPENKEKVNEITYCDKLARNVQPIIFHLDSSVQAILGDPSREKWKVDAESSWKSFKGEQKNHWNGLLQIFVEFQLKYDHRLEEYKREMRDKIRRLFENPENLKMSEGEKDAKFEEMYSQVLQDAKTRQSSVNVKQRVEDIYRTSPVIRTSQVSVADSDIEHKMAPLVEKICGASVQSSTQQTESSPVPVNKVINKVKKSLFTYTEKINQYLPWPAWPEKVYGELYDKIMSWLQDKKCFVNNLVDEVINITTSVTISNKHVSGSQLQSAHIFAKLLVTRHMAEVQKNWETNNSVYAKLSQPESRREMKVYFDQASRGVVESNLFTVMLTWNLEKILSEGFEEEMLLLTMDRVSSRNWLLDPKALLNYMDLELIDLIDNKEIELALHKIGNPQRFYDEVLMKLIWREVPDLDQESERFCRKIKEIIESAASAASQVESGRAKRFINEVPKLGKNSGFRDKNFLAKKFTTDDSGYDGCDIENPEEFRKQLTESLHQAADKARGNSMKPASPKFVEDVLNRLRGERMEEGARPRCNESCPLCKSLCILPFGHGSAKKHDTFHQPRGLTGGHWIEGTLISHNCSTVDKKISFFYNQKWNHYKDYGTVFPNWMQPTIRENLPLREYIFANYQKEIADWYKVEPCTDIPNKYRQRNLSNIRYDLHQKTNTLPSPTD